MADGRWPRWPNRRLPDRRWPLCEPAVHPNSSFQFERLEKAAKGLVRRPSFVRQASSSGASPKNLQRRKDLSVPAQALLAALTAAAPAERPTAGSMVVRNWLSLMETAPELLPAQVLK